ncbi:Cytochrome P450 [Naviculisporaceae sp. PSN 640]
MAFASLELYNILPLIVASATLLAAYLVGTRMFGRHDAREPPLAPQTIPFIGHMVGMARSKFNYYVDLSKQTDSPIFTIAFPGQKMYVVTKPDLIHAVQKQPKVLAFPPIEAKFAATICGVSSEAKQILAQNANGDDGDHGLAMESYDGMRAALKPGAGLDDMNRVMLQEIVESLDVLLQPSTATHASSPTIGLYSWLRDAITTATTRSVYGPHNPFNDKAIADAFWDFENGLMTILVGILPSITARKAVAARDKVAKAFETYYKTPGSVENASIFAQKRYEAEINNKVPLEDIARFEVGGSLAILVNTAPAAFWTLFFAYASPGLLAEIRAEVESCIEISYSGSSVVKTINLTALKKQCPLLLSAYQETLRYRTMGTSVREVMEDTVLDGRWLLKKGAMLQMPSRIIHQDSGLWGSDVADFNPRRFLPGQQEKKNRPGNACFRAFGGGSTLCPGRHFATNEVLAVVALFVSRFDMAPADNQTSGWQLPTAANTNVAAQVMEPDYDIEVRITPRPGVGDNVRVKWAISLDGSDKVFAMVTEDMAGIGEAK